MTRRVQTISSIFALILVSLIAGNAFAQLVEPLYVDGSTSTLVITTETNSRGAADATEASITGELANANNWTFSFDNTANGTLPLISADIYLTHRQTGMVDDSVVIEYFDGTTWNEFESLANATGTLATYGPFSTNLTTTTQLDGFQVRMRGVQVNNTADAITYSVDAIELRATLDDNVAPVLDPIGAQSVTEGQLLSFTVTASDSNGTTPTMLINNKPTNASYADNANGTGSFSWTPNYTEAGLYNVTFIASDGILADSELVAITVNEAGNQSPVVTDIPDQTIAEGGSFATISLDDYVSDLDNLDSEMNWTFSGDSALTVSIDVNRVATISTPSIDWNGAETITFTATDPSAAADSNAAIFTVTAVNDAPVVADIPDQTVPEGASFATVALDDFVTDVDNLDSTISWTYSGNTELTVSIDANRVATISTPGVEWNGSETITFTATDPGLLADSNAATFTVTAVNDVPIVTDIPDQTVAEGASFATIALDDFVSDLDNLDSEMSWTFTGNSALSVSIDINRVATISTPSADWNGAETITFTATDPGLAADSNAATFTVTAINDAPVVSDIPDQTISEGSSFATIALDDFVTDVDDLDSTINWTFSGDSALTVSIDVNRVATIGTPGVDWNGAETITFTATDIGLLADSNAATFTVTAVNDPPIVTDIPDQTVAEGASFATIALDDFVSDVDNLDSELNWTYAGNSELTVSIDINRVATITIPNADWFGSETITFTATDPGAEFDSDPATFTVTNVNDAPIVSDIPDQTIAEGATFATINLDSYVTDIDNLASEISWTYSGNTDLIVSIVNRVASISAPDIDWNGAETITFTATDPGLLADSNAATFTVTAINDAPVVSDIPDQTIDEGSTFTTVALDDYVTDVDNLDSEIGWTYNGNTDLTVSIDINRVATISTPGIDWNGAETITFTATDPGALADSNAATFTVNAVNDAPVVTDIPDQTIAEGGSFATINLDDFVSDVDNIDADMNWTYSGNTELIVSIVSRVATITTPNVDWNGAETITFTATDPGLLFSSDAATFTVTGINDAPIVSDIPDQTIDEGSTFATINLDNYVTDIDNLDSEIGWTYNGNTELTVSIDINRVATISTPGVDWNGAETITFTATDPGALADSNAATFTVNAVNDAPIVTDIPDQTIAEGATFTAINLDSYVSDVDNLNSELTWSYSGNSELSISIVNDVAIITVPNPDWNGSEAITFTATDPGLATGSDIATFTVTGINDAPVVSNIPDQTIAEGGSFAAINLDDYVSDVDNLDSEMSWTHLGNTELTVSIVNRIATITTPSSTWNGAETITFTATDPGLLNSSDQATFTVTAVNDAPVVTDIPDQTIAEGASFATINLDDYVSDIDNLDSEITWTYSGNTDLTVSIVSRVATITPPDTDWNGSELITFTATDPNLLSNSDAANFTVTAVNDAPVVADIPDQTVNEGAIFATVSLDSYVSDVDNLASEMNWTYSGNTELTVSIDINRVATITIPTTDWYGAETITFTATDPGLLADSNAATFTVTNINDGPVVTDIPDQTIAEATSFATINLDDFVSDIDNLDSDISWTYSGNTDLIVSIDINRVATVSAPDGDWNGAETITFTATDPGLLTDSDSATFTVTPVNDAPVVADIPDQTVAEGASFTTINLDTYVSDVDNDITTMNWTYSGNTELSVSIVNRLAFITIPGPEWNGSETITFTATDPGLLSGSDPATFTVTTVNDPPVVTNIPDQTIAEGATFATINLDDYVSDADNLDSEIGWSYLGNSQLSVSIDINRVATIAMPTPDWNGSEVITFTATDPGLLTDSDPATFTVTAVNDAPVVADIPDQTIDEGASFATISLDDFVTDVDNLDSELSWTYSGSTELTVVIDAGHVATITTPGAEWSGAETITFTATDPGLLFGSDAATFTVNTVNDPPVVTDIPDQTVAEGSTFTTINLDNYVSDLDNLDSEMNWSYSGNTELTVAIDINRIATITIPNSDWNGNETITFTATDPGLAADSDPATFTVTAVNDAPVVADIPDQTIAEGGSFATINLDDYVSDVDNLDSEVSWTYGGNTELTVAIDINRIATITTPDANWNGSEIITFTATDPGLLADSDPATLTVTAVNNAPVVTDIPDQTIAEGASFATINLDDFVSDIDNLDSEIGWTYSGNTDLTVSIDINRVATITPPDGDWNGSELITFTATDPSLLSNSDPATFTITAVNDAPVVADIPDQTIIEGSNFTTINLDAYVSDVDNIAADMSWSFVGNVELSVSIVNRVAIISTPNNDWSGSEIITFTATDPGLLTGSDPAQFTVTAVNDAPVVADIPNQTVAEGATFVTISLDDYVSDPDNLDSEMSWSFIGNSQLSVSLDVNRVATITIPSADWNGSEVITFTATDPGLLSDSDPAQFTVTAVNDAPVVTDIPDQTIDEGSNFVTVNLDNYVSDVDNLDSEMAWTYAGNTELTVAIDINRVATITIPNANWNGSETITFTATDPGLLAGSDPATFTVNAVNDAPVVTDIPDQSIAEGSTFTTIALDNFVSDLDNLDSEMNWTYSGDTELTVAIDINRIATITIPNADWNGSETITFTATDPGLLADSDPATFTVTGINDAPVVADIPDQTVAEGATFATIALDNFVSDVDNLDSEINWTYTGNTELTVAIDINRVATITIPTPEWNGSETITFTATDPGLLTDSDPATFTVTAVNDAPIVADIPDQTVAEGANFATIALDDFVTDADNLDSEISWTYAGNTELTVAIDINRVATITIPDIEWNGAETITFTATDPTLLSNSDPATFTVTAVNDAPIVTDIPDQTIIEGSSFTAINLDDYVSDIDNLDAEMTWAFAGNADLTVSIVNRVAIITPPTADWNGAESITFTATDPGLLADSNAATFTVTGVSDAPVVSNIPDQTIAEGASFATIALDDFVTDADNLDSEMTWTYSGNSALTVAIDINRVATITTPDANWNGAETITFTATDPTLLSDSDPASFTVAAVNDEPVLAAIGAQATDENVNLNFGVAASDIDGDTPVLSTSLLPAGAAFTDNTDGTGTLDWTPTYDDSGTYVITFYATDAIVPTAVDSELVTITVNNINRDPILSTIGAQAVDENTLLSFNTGAVDPDGDIPIMTSSTVPTGASYTDNLDGTGTFSWTPTFADSGTFTVTFYATDQFFASSVDSEVVTITVNNVNQVPILATIGPRGTSENTNLNFVTSASDADGDTPIMTAANLPLGASYNDNLDGTGTFDWTPTFGDEGVYNVTFYATDQFYPADVDSEVVVITISNTNRQPVADAGPDQFDITVGTLVTLDGRGSTDPDSDPLNYSWLQIGGTGVTLSSAADSTPTFTPVTPGSYSFELTVDDGALTSSPDSVTINVINAAPPAAVTDLAITITTDALNMTWSAVVLDSDGLPTTVDHYVIYRGSSAYFTPTPTDSIGGTATAVTTFTDNNIGGADVVGDTLTNYFYVVEAVDAFGNRSALSNRVGEFDYQVVTTATTDFSLVGIPFTNSGITDADGLIAAIGASNVATVNNYVVASQSFESRFAAGFGTNFAVTAGKIYQVNAISSTVFSIAGNVPDPGTISYSLQTTATTSFNYLMIPFELESSFSLAQDLINSIPGTLNTLNNFISASQSYESRFAIGFGTNFEVKAGKPYQGNVAADGVFPAP